MIKIRNHAFALLATTFLLVVCHSLVPHWHVARQHKVAVDQTDQGLSLEDFLGVLVSLNLGQDHLEHFSPGSDVDVPPVILAQDLVMVLSILPIEENEEAHPDWPVDLHRSVAAFFTPTTVSFRGPPAKNA